MGTQGTGRRRSTNKERSTAEDDALNLIAREAEARLAAKRAARAEAREIRMKELERQQKEIFQVQKKYYGLNPKVDDRMDSKWGDIEQWMEDSERYSRPSRTHTLSDDDERMSVGSRGSVRSDLDAAYGGGGSSSHSHKKSKKKKKHKHKDRDRNGYDDEYSVISSRSSRLSDESRASRSSRVDLTSSRLSDDSRVSRASRLDLQPASYASSDLYNLNGLSSSRNPGSTFNGYQSSLYEDSLCSGSRRVTGSSSHPLDYTSYRSSGSRASSRASSARASPVDNCGSVASFLRSAGSSSGLHRDLDDVTIPDFSDVEDRDYLEKGSRAASALTAATLTSLGGTSSRRGSGETAITVDAETSIREIKEIHELKDQIQDVETKYTQNLKEAKDALVEVEEKYRKAMVSNAQLDNEKNNLMYQVDTLKDSLMELEELLSESRRAHEEKIKEYEREKHAHNVLQFQFSEMKETLKQSEELLNEIRQLRIKQDGFVREVSDLQETVEWKDKKIGALERQKEYTDAIRIERDELREEVVKLKDVLKKHGIVLGPDLNVNGDVGETETDGTSSGDTAARPAQDSQPSPTEGNSMLGSTEETQLRSSGEEEVDPEQHQEILEEAEKNHLSSDMLCNVSAVETSSKEQPTEEQQTCLPTEEDSDGGTESNDLQVDINENPVNEAKDVIICSPELQEIETSPEENIPGTEILKGEDLGETGTKSIGVDTHSDDIRETCNNLVEVQENKQEDVEESNLRNTESCPQQKVTEDVMKEPEESIRAVANSEPHQEPENADEDDEAEETSSKSQPQGATASGKKKKRKRRGKKKGGANEEKKQQKDANKENGKDKENGKTEKDINLAAKDNGSTTEPDTDVSATETLKQFKMAEVMNDAVETVEPTETCPHIETPKEPRVDRVTDEQKEEQSVEAETVEEVEAVAPAENDSLAETLKESTAEHLKDEQDMEQTSETKKAEEEEDLKTSPDTEANVCASDLIDNPECTESTDGLDKECTPSVDNCKSGDLAPKGDLHTELGIEPVDEIPTKNPEDTLESTNCNEDTEAESHVPSDADAAVESTNGSETEDKTSVAPSSTDDFIDGPKSPSGSEPSAADMPIEVIDKSTEEETEAAKEEDEEPGAETDQQSVSPSQEDDDDSELKLDRSEKEEPNEDLREPEALVEPDNSSHDDKGDNVSMKHTDALETEKSPLETAAPAEHLDDAESQTVQCADQTAESNADVSSETEQINTSEIIKTPDSPKEAAASVIEEEHNSEESAAAEDPERTISQNDQESEKCQQESSKDDSEDDNSSRPTQQCSDEEDGDDEEGQSFDFDDMDIEATRDMNIPQTSEEEEVEQGVEVTSDESNDVSSNNIESNEKTQDEPVDSKDKKCAVDQVDAPDKESDTKPQGNQNSLAHEETTSESVDSELQEKVDVADIKEGEVSNVGELAVAESNSAENINQAMASSVEEGVDAIKHELQDEVLPKSADQVDKEPPLAGKDMKKNGKKGKSKGKEECKMS